MKLWKLGMVLGMVVGVGCGGEASPEEKCENIGDSLCERAAQCTQAPDTARDACFSAFKAENHCSLVKDVTGDYDLCLDQLETASCASLITASSTLPPACEAVRLIVEGRDASDAVSRAVVRGMLAR